MRKPILVIVAALLSLAMIPFAAQAQEASCDIDVQDVVSTLIEAQTLAAQGNTTDAQAKLADAQAALDTIKATCSLQSAPIELPQTFVAPDQSLAFDYPKGWVIGEYDKTNVEGAPGGNTIFASNEGVFENIDKQPDEWLFASGDIFAYVGVGSQEVIVRDAGVFDADNPVDNNTPIEKLVEAFRTGLVKQVEGSTVGEVDRLQINDRKAAMFSFSRANFEGAVVLLDLGRGRYGATIVISNPDDAAQTSQIAQVIAATVR